MPRIAGLDELRGIAILLVLVAHYLGTRTPDLVYPDLTAGTVGEQTRIVAARPHVVLDSPAEGAPLSGLVSVRGWAIDRATAGRSGIASVEIFVDSELVGSAAYGQERPDVAAHFGDEQLRDVGWSLEWDSSTVRPGPHAITVKARSRAGADAWYTRAVIIPGPESTSAGESESSYGFDLPGAGSVVSGTVGVAGWALNPSSTSGTGVAQVDVYVDGTLVGPAVYGIERPDVASYFHHDRFRPVGWQYAWDTSNLTPGPHTIEVKARALPADDVERISSATSPTSVGTFVVAPATANSATEVAANVDRLTRPLAGQGVIIVEGWAVDRARPDGGGIQQIDLYLNATPLGSATYGTDRPDIAARFQDARYGTSGWKHTLDRSGLSDGPHTLGLNVQTVGGAEERFETGVTIKARNWPWDAPWNMVVAQVGVDLFFVISGFLITLILVRTKGIPKYFRTFYMRRALRILPLAWVVIAISALIDPGHLYLVPFYLGFVNNFSDVYYGDTMFGIAQMWSLAVEEQFYVIFPVVCFFTPRRLLWVSVAITIVVFGTLRVTTGFQVDSLYTGEPRTYIRALMIATGAWLALNHGSLIPRPKIASLALLAYTVSVPALFGGSIGWLELPVSVLLLALVYLAASGRFVLSVGVLRFLGVRCYSLYLLHLFLVIAMVKLWPNRLPVPLDFAVYLGLCVLWAHVSYEHFEKPIMARKPGYGSTEQVAGEVDERSDARPVAPATV